MLHIGDAIHTILHEELFHFARNSWLDRFLRRWLHSTSTLQRQMWPHLYAGTI